MNKGIHIINLDTDEDIRFLDLARREQRYFNDSEDSALLWRGFLHATRIAGELGISRRLLDLGSDISLGASLALSEGELDSARAMDVNAAAVRRGQELAAKLGVYHDRERYEIVCADVETATAQQYAEKFQPTIISGNLPYLPQRLSTPDLTRDAGIDGTRFIEILLSYSRLPSVQLVTLNMCSMTTPKRTLQMFAVHGLTIDAVFAFKNVFGYRTKLLLKQGVIDESRGQFFHMASDGTPYQIMMNLVMSRSPIRNDKVNSQQILAMFSHFSKTGDVSDS
jgi:hypothetical protein